MSYISKLQYIKTQINTEPKRKRVTLLGATGTIGKNTLAIIKNTPQQFEVFALAGGKNISLLAQQALEFRPSFLAIQHEDDLNTLRALLPPTYQPEIVFGKAGYALIASLPEVDIVVSAQVGAAGLRATVAAAEAGKIICLANKESLVLAGDLIRYVVQKNNAIVLPVDSEHYAIFQCLSAQYFKNTSHSSPSDAMSITIPHIQKLILTASGGPFKGKNKKNLENVSKADALNHPNWNMGAKISIDSATLMNKGLEVIEACHLYGLPMHQVDVLVHPQSIIHSLVEWQDGSVLAQLANPDMRLPIGACLAWPDMLNKEMNTLKALDLTQHTLTFEKPDTNNFPCLQLAREAYEENLCIELNAANEVAVDLFLHDKIKFTQIPELVEKVMQKTTINKVIDFTKISVENALLEIEKRDSVGRKLALSLSN